MSCHQSRVKSKTPGQRWCLCSLHAKTLHSHPPQMAAPAQDEYLLVQRVDRGGRAGEEGPTSFESTPRSLARGVARAGVLTMYCTTGLTTGDSACSMLASIGTSAIRLSSATAGIAACDRSCFF